MKSLLVASSIIAMASSGALAGSINPSVVEPAPTAPAAMPAPSTPTWTGFHVGGSVTYAKGKVKADNELKSLLSGAGIDDTFGSPDGFGGAVRLGYDYEFNKFVVGLGGSYDFGHYSDDKDFFGVNIHTKVKNLGTVYGRAGYDMGKWMPYVLAGYTWGKGEASVLGTSAKVDLSGYTLGIGAEYRFTRNWSGFAEYNYTDFGNIEHTDDLLKAHLNRLNLGVNYRF